jgi:hypothetical protein
MSRWLVLAVLSLAPAALGCGASVSASVHPGLANAPKLGSGPSSEDHVTDVVANGDDGCGRTPELAGQPGANGYPGNRVPPCATLSLTRPVAATVTPSPANEPGELVQPWLNHFYVGWPCPQLSSRQARTWTASTAVATCTLP